MVAADPHQAGASWAVLQYVLGLARLGHEVTFVEPVAEPTAEVTVYFGRLVRAFRLDGRASLVVGGRLDEVTAERLRKADVLLNISGMLRAEEVARIPIRVYLDLDPAFNQLWHESGVDVGFPGHTHYVTVGQALAGGDSDLPTCGLDWIGTPPPVVLDLWRPAGKIETDAFTTVGNWRSYGPVERNGVRYGLRAHSLRGLLDLPARVDERFALALAVDPGDDADIKALHAAGFELVDPRRVAATPSAYRRFVRGSRGELGVAKEGYVVSRSGWFSDRSACYLAAGRPVVAQDTGFGAYLPSGAGLFAFADLDEAAAAFAEIRRDYGRHARAARAIAEEHLDSGGVLTRLLEAVGAVAPAVHRRVYDATERELAEALAPLAVARIRRRPFEYRASAALLQLEVELADGSSRVMLAKDLGSAGRIASAATAKPQLLDDPLREIETYRRSLGDAGLGTPAFLGSSVDEAAGRYWLLLERVAGTELYQVGERELWERTAQWAARLHDAALPRHEHLLVYDRAYHELWFERARAAGHDVPAAWETAIEELLRAPSTLLHGELYASNVLVAGERVAAVDWELAALGPPAVDLAALVTGWEGADREALVAAYLEESSAPADGFRETLAAARLHLALRWLGWSTDWTAPPEHSRDWLAEARAAATELGL
jgi:hypothetical protein